MRTTSFSTVATEIVPMLVWMTIALNSRHLGKILERVSSFYACLLQAIDGARSLALRLQVVSSSRTLRLAIMYCHTFGCKMSIFHKTWSEHFLFIFNPCCDLDLEGSNIFFFFLMWWQVNYSIRNAKQTTHRWYVREANYLQKRTWIVVHKLKSYIA